MIYIGFHQTQLFLQSLDFPHSPHYTPSMTLSELAKKLHTSEPAVIRKYGRQEDYPSSILAEPRNPQRWWNRKRQAIAQGRREGRMPRNSPLTLTKVWLENKTFLCSTVCVCGHTQIMAFKTAQRITKCSDFVHIATE